MLKLFLFCILLVICWPLALLALILYPLIWLLLLPFRLLGIVVEGAFAHRSHLPSARKSSPRHLARGL